VCGARAHADRGQVLTSFCVLPSPLSADSARGAAWTRGAHASTTTISALSTASASLFLLVAWSSSDALVRAGIL
jgi:hypothetical protein